MCLNNFFHLYKVLQKQGLHIKETQDSSKPICICQQLHRISIFFFFLFLYQKIVKNKKLDQIVETEKWVCLIRDYSVILDDEIWIWD